MTIETRYDAKLNAIGYDVIDPQQPTPESLRAYESAIGATLPEDYREFVWKFGLTGLGRDGYVYCPMKEACSWGELLTDVFYGFLPDDTYDLTEALRAYRGRAPANLVPIGSDPGGNQIMLSIEGPDRGKVYFWDHEHREVGGPEKLDAMYDDLKAAGIETARLDSDRAILRWEELNASRLAKPPGYGNVYLLADSFEDFVERLRYEPEN